MKNAAALLVALILTVSICHAVSVYPNSTEVKIIAVKSHAVYFKVNESFVGGTVEVYDVNEKLLEAERLPQAHSMVLFHEKPSGKYMIKVKKGNKTVEFGYIHI